MIQVSMVSISEKVSSSQIDGNDVHKMYSFNRSFLSKYTHQKGFALLILISLYFYLPIYIYIFIYI